MEAGDLESSLSRLHGGGWGIGVHGSAKPTLPHLQPVPEQTDLGVWTLKGINSSSLGPRDPFENAN